MSNDNVCSICGAYECNESKCKIKNIVKCLNEIEKLQKELCRRCDLTFCGNTVCYEILQKIKEVK